MITLLYGENDFALTKKVAQLRADFKGVSERYDAADLTNEKLADIFAGQTLFAVNRLVIIDAPASNSELWQHLPAWADRLSAETNLVLVEAKPDKRTSTFKWLQKNADVQVFSPIDQRDIAKWVADYAAAQSISLSTHQVGRLAERIGPDQWELAQAVDKLALLGDITDGWIDTIAEQTPSESVFALLETALNGDTHRLAEMLQTLRMSEEPYRVMGLIISQVLQLCALIYGRGDIAKVARDTGAKSSYPLQKLAPYATRLSRQQASDMVTILAEADERIKKSDADPWLVLESSLARVASLAGT